MPFYALLDSNVAFTVLRIQKWQIIHRQFNVLYANSTIIKIGSFIVCIDKIVKSLS